MKKLNVLLIFLLILSMLFSCGEGTTPGTDPGQNPGNGVNQPSVPNGSDTSGTQPMKTVTVTLTDIPVYNGTLSIPINNNVPFFKVSDLTTTSYEFYSNLDALGRVGYAMASLSTDTMPTEDRGSISSVTPTGWRQASYDSVPGKYLYNRCHLIGWQLSAENANKKNLMTGTPYFNASDPKDGALDADKKNGMLHFENMIADYIKETGNHVLVRVTPVFSGNNLLAHGVLLEAQSVEDDDIQFNVFIYNVQPEITIDYATGESRETPGFTNQGDSGFIPNIRLEFEMSVPLEEGDVPSDPPLVDGPSSENPPTQDPPDEEVKIEYVLNTETKKVHISSCSYVKNISLKNTEIRPMTLSELLELLKSGYSACKTCLSDYAQ